MAVVVVFALPFARARLPVPSGLAYALEPGGGALGITLTDRPDDGERTSSGSFASSV